MVKKLMDEELDFDASYAIYKKEYEKYFPPPPPVQAVEDNKAKPKLKIVAPESLKVKVADLDLFSRPSKILKKLNIETVGELIQLSAKELRQKDRLLGKKSIQDINDQLSRFGLSLRKDDEGQ